MRPLEVTAEPWGSSRFPDRSATVVITDECRSTVGLSTVGPSAAGLSAVGLAAVSSPLATCATSNRHVRAMTGVAVIGWFVGCPQDRRGRPPPRHHVGVWGAGPSGEKHDPHE